jgi:hypothetical protein
MNMEYNIGLFITGLFILLVTVYRLRKVRRQHELQYRLETAYEVDNLDLSGNTQYASCFSHKWVMKNITMKSHSRLGAMLQNHLADSTLFAFMWIGFIVGTSSMLLTLLLVQSMRAIGTVIVIFMVGVLIAMGPGGPRYSENLLDAVMGVEIDNLNSQDYVYVKLANDTITHSAIINVAIASIFILISPWGQFLPSFLAQGIALFTVTIILNPASFLMQFNIGAAIVYIAGIIGVSSFTCFRVGRRLLSSEEGESRIQY